ncbi:MAG: hypothetical protein K2P80_08120 [Beijerinckiaceae bacterium]|nr:hypothetical protein [Beijerinckiaceae bacterium]
MATGLRAAEAFGKSTRNAALVFGFEISDLDHCHGPHSCEDCDSEDSGQNAPLALGCKKASNILHEGLLTIDEICESLERLSVVCTKTKIARWQTQGLIPQPSRQGMGRGKGRSIALYPAITVEQIRCIDVLLGQKRDANFVGWQLWLRGYQVDDIYWRQPFKQASEHWRVGKGHLISVYDDDSFDSDPVAELTSSLFDAEVDSSFFRRTRKRIGRERFQNFLTVIFTIAIGIYESYRSSEEDKFKNELIKTLDAGLGLTDARTQYVGILKSLINFDYRDILENISSVINKFDFEKAVLNENLINFARDDFFLLVDIFNKSASISQILIGKIGFGLKVASELNQLTEAQQAMMICLWSMLGPKIERSDQFQPKNLKFIRGQLEVALAQLKANPPVDKLKLKTRVPRYK